MSEQKIENVVIMGGGPAGLSAAIYNSRANLAPVVFAGSPPGGQLMWTTEVENFPGQEHITGPELVEQMRKQAQKFGTTIHDKNILKIDFSKRPFEIFYDETSVLSKSIIISTGAQALWLGLESEQRLRGRGVSACATCDGFFFRNKIVAVIGGGDTAMEEAMVLTKFAQKVYVIHRRDTFRASKVMQDRVLAHPQIEVKWNSGVEEVLGENKVEGIKLKKTNGEVETIALNGIFLAIGHKPDTDVFKEQIKLDEKGYVLTSMMAAYIHASSPERLNISDFNLHFQTMTNIPGVFAGGDCVDHVYRQAGTAAGMGIAAALDAEKWLSDQN
jgi:thioredoxin reductase (NADPH)